MSSRPSTFKETDIKRAFRAAKIAGIDVARLDIGRDGKISIVPTSAVVGGNKAESPKIPSVAGLQSWD
jgi:hypothetical protein